MSAVSELAYDSLVDEVNMPITILLLMGLIIPCYAHELPDTGQTQSYTATFGEDHDYQPPETQMSYTDNGNGTVTDNKTGLMWMKTGNYAFNSVSSTGTWEQALGYCENLVYAGYSDWRLPNRRELFSIVDFGPSSVPSINTAYFTNTLWDAYYWTSSSFDNTNAWVVGFNSGFVAGYNKTNLFYVRCVRAGPQ